MPSIENPSSSHANDSQIETWLSRLRELYGAKTADYETELPYLREYLPRLKSELRGLYELIEPLSVGGSGITFLVSHPRIPQKLLLKFNRPFTLQGVASITENERQILPLMDHANIIRLVDRGRIDDLTPQLSYIIVPFVESLASGSGRSPTIDRYLGLLASGVDPSERLPQALVRERLDGILYEVTKLVHQWASALKHIHERNHIYLDVKPDNALVDKNGHLCIIDLGSAQRLDAKDENPMEVQFTDRYAHPWLLHLKDLRRTSPRRLRAAIKRKDLRVEFDYYALGKSILELLGEVAVRRPHDCPQRPRYRALHFLATRLLDGQNEEEIPRPMASQIFGTLLKRDYKTMSYSSKSSLSDVLRDLEKELGSWNPELAVPELETYSKEMVRVVPNLNTVLTSRLRALIEHPIFARLKQTTELGLISLIYTTADYSRYDHLLGAYTYVASYVKSLFNDSYNPIFRNLVEEHDIKAVLLAALLHDLGQYPLAHDLEEVSSAVFGHSKLTIELLSDPKKDKKGRTLEDIIKDERIGWGVDPDWLKRILGARSSHLTLFEQPGPRDFKVDMLAALIDGPIDADKADYIVRDSAACRVPYGNQLDLERLLRVLTVAVLPDKVTVGVYRKGIAAAQAFGLARYLLFASVYWHHTNRILKAMLQYATAMLLPREVFLGRPDPDNEQIRQVREKLRTFAVDLAPPFSIEDIKESSLVSVKEEMIPRSSIEEPPERVDALSAYGPSREVGEEERDHWYPGISYTDWLMLKWLRKQSREERRASRLIGGIMRRDLYKRLVTLSHGENKSLIERLERLSWPDRISLCERIQQKIHEAVRRSWDQLDTKPFNNLEEADIAFQQNLAILVDIPNHGRSTGSDRPLYIVPELKEKSYYESGEAPVEVPGWRDAMDVLMTSIAPVTVLCHGSLRQLISASISDLQPKMIGLLQQTLAEMSR